MKVLITGAGGMLGADLQAVLASEHELVLTDVLGDLEFLDITNEGRVLDVVGECRPDLVIHAAAYTDVDLSLIHI